MREQIAQIAPSIIESGWTNPVLIAGDGTVIAGHGRLDAARRLRLDAVPVLILDHLSERRASLNWREAINFRL
jgi:ParB-like chromosome segregation protein Spo0J